MTPFRALAETLDRLADAIRPLTAGEYASCELRSSGSIGAHVRHCLDHVSALECGIVRGEVCYDHRARNTVVEREPYLAASRLRRASFRLNQIDSRQWTLTFEISAANRARGHVPATGRRLPTLSLQHLRHTPALPVSS